MDRWGVFSVIDHRDPIRLATEVLLYDKLAVPTPTDRDGPDWQRWQRAKWDPEGLDNALALLRPHDLVRETSWDATRQAEWAVLFADARASMAKANAEMARDLGRAEVSGDDLAALKRAEELLPYKITRHAMIKHLRGKQNLFNGAVEFYAAYQSAAEFTSLHPEAAAAAGGEVQHADPVGAANLIIANDLAVPDEAPETLLERAVALATRDSFRRRRRNFYDWQLTLLERGHSPQVVARELKQLVDDYNSDITKHFEKVRWERAFTVLAVLGAGLGAAAAFGPALAATFGVGAEALRAGIALTSAGNAAMIAIGKFQLAPREPDGAARVAAAGAMFHDIAKHVGFEVRTRREMG